MIGHLAFIFFICFPSFLLGLLQKNTRAIPHNIGSERSIYNRRIDSPIQEENSYGGLTYDPRSSPYRSDKIVPHFNMRDYQNNFEFFDPLQVLRSFTPAENIGSFPQSTALNVQTNAKQQMNSESSQNSLPQNYLKFIQMSQPLQQILQQKFGGVKYGDSLSMIDLNKTSNDTSDIKSTSTSTTKLPSINGVSKSKLAENVGITSKTQLKSKNAKNNKLQPMKPNQENLGGQSGNKTLISSNVDKKNTSPKPLKHRPLDETFIETNLKNNYGINSQSSGINLSDIFTYKIMDDKNINWDGKFFQFTLSFFNMHDIPIHTREYSNGEKAIMNQIRQDRNMSAYKMNVLVSQYNRDKMIRLSSDVCAYRGHDCLSCLVDFQCSFCPADRSCYDRKLAFDFLKDRELCSGHAPYYYMSCNISSVAIFAWLIVLLIFVVCLLVLICVLSCCISYYRRDVRKFYSLSGK